MHSWSITSFGTDRILYHRMCQLPLISFFKSNFEHEMKVSETRKLLIKIFDVVRILSNIQTSKRNSHHFLSAHRCLLSSLRILLNQQDCAVLLCSSKCLCLCVKVTRFFTHLAREQCVPLRQRCHCHLPGDDESGGGDNGGYQTPSRNTKLIIFLFWRDKNHARVPRIMHAPSTSSSPCIIAV